MIVKPYYIEMEEKGRKCPTAFNSKKEWDKYMFEDKIYIVKVLAENLCDAYMVARRDNPVLRLCEEKIMVETYIDNAERRI